LLSSILLAGREIEFEDDEDDEDEEEEMDTEKVMDGLYIVSY
jgi:hypothetical protein